MENMILLPDGLTVFLAEETTKGTPKAPAAGDSVVVTEGLKFPSQPTAHSSAKEALATRGVTALMRDLRNAGQVTIPTLLRPSGAAGTAPAEDELWNALLGSETVTPATSVAYKGAVAKKTFTLWIKTANGVVFCTGCVGSALKLSGEANGFPKADWELMFRELRFCGEDELSAAELTGQTVLSVKDASKFCVGAIVKVGADTNSGAGYAITAVDLDADTITVSPALGTDAADDAVVTPYLPTPTVVGEPLDYRPAVKVAGSAIKWKSWEISVSDPVNFITDEVTEDPTQADYPTAHALRSGREVKATVKCVMRTDDLTRIRADDADRAFEVEFSAGGTAGRKLKLAMAQGRYQVPAIETGDPAIEFSLEFTAKQSAIGQEDELVATYT